VPEQLNLDHLSHAEKDALIRTLCQRLEAAERHIAELEALLAKPGKTPDNSSLPPSKGEKPNRPEKAKRSGPRKGSLGRKGGGRPLACDPDETITAKVPVCAHCQAGLTDADQLLHSRYDHIDLPVVRPLVTRVERYAGHSLVLPFPPASRTEPLASLARAAAASPWRRCLRAWRTPRRSASTSWRWRSICALPTRSATAG
jgi:hypothetical protein